MKKITKLLVANRGEIALRIFRAAKELGIRSVGIYTDIEKDLPHALECDQAVSLGEGALSETYLNIPKIIKIAQSQGCDAIHPGYGFLSERALFAKACQDAGIIFIGPPIHAIECMGDKKTSKDVVAGTKAPLIPGHHGDDQSVAILKAEAQKIGTPLLIKASAGGGGKGMRIVRDLASFEEELSSAKSESLNAFGDDRVLLEKYIEQPRHIEVQILSDSQGNHLHLFERECSIQRRYQKVIEESPAPHLSQGAREKICEAAVSIARKIDYVGAGTVEFIVDHKEDFFFLEMNTRLQVEHPITEIVTGIDLPKWQILIASGQEIPFKQSEIYQRGHAIECRVYAEDPDKGFLPSSGHISYLGKSDWPSIRFDCGLYDQQDIMLDFDPMLAKVIVSADERESARQKMLMALDEYPFLGAITNRDYLVRLLEHPVFVEGKVHTGMIEENTESLKKKTLSSKEKAIGLLGLLLGQRQTSSTSYSQKTPTAWENIGQKRLG